MTLENALCGATIEVDLLNGETLDVTVDDVISDGFVHQVKGKGMPVRGTEDEFGDLHIHFTVAFPKSIEDGDKKKLRKILSELEYS